MKLGVSYNVWDGEELLEKSIYSIRDSVDFVSVVYQRVSNHGYAHDPYPKLKEIYEKGLIDELYKFIPEKNKHPAINEITKRNIGIGLSEKENCTYHLSLDVDEFYFKNQLEFVKRKIEMAGYDYSICEYVNYYKKPIYQISMGKRTFVGLIIKTNKRFDLLAPTLVLVDCTRAAKGYYKLFQKHEILMHHMSYIRENLFRKLVNSSEPLANRSAIEINAYWRKWKYPQEAMLPQGRYPVIKVPDYFKIGGLK